MHVSSFNVIIKNMSTTQTKNDIFLNDTCMERNTIESLVVKYNYRAILTLWTPCTKVNVCMHIHTQPLKTSIRKKCVDHKSFMMHANACCTCNFISTCTCLLPKQECVTQISVVIILKKSVHSSSLLTSVWVVKTTYTR